LPEVVFVGAIVNHALSFRRMRVALGEESAFRLRTGEQRVPRRFAPRNDKELRKQWRPLLLGRLHASLRFLGTDECVRTYANLIARRPSQVRCWPSPGFARQLRCLPFG